MSAADTAVQVLVASVIGVPILAFCGALGLAQLKFLLTALHHLSSPNGGLPRPVRSYIQRLSSLVEPIFGPPQKFAPNLTHILLAAIILCLLLLAIRIGGLGARNRK